MSYRPDRATATRDLLAIANTEHTPEAVFPITRETVLAQHYDHLRSADAAVSFLRARASFVPRGTPTRTELAALAELRAATRALADADRAAYRRHFAALTSRCHYRLDKDGFVPERTGWLGFVAALLPSLRELAEDTERLRACANCEWLFYDRSRKGGKVWCDTFACGNRVKVRRFRERRHRRPRVPSRA